MRRKFSRAVQPRFDGADVRVNGSRDLGQRQAFVLGEDHHLSLQRAERAHGLTHHLADIAAVEIDDLSGHRLFVQRLVAMFGSPLLEREVPGNPKEEGAQRPASRIEPIRMSQQADEHVLRDVLGRGWARHAPDEPVDDVLVVLEGGLKLSVVHVARYLLPDDGPKDTGD